MNYQAKPGANKGEKKQEKWLTVVQTLLDTSNNLSGPERKFLEHISGHSNIPRKKAKFMNFIKSSMGNRVNSQVVESVWLKMEEASKCEPEKGKL